MANNRAKMPINQRAKQFMPFDAVIGLRAALKEKEKIKENRKIASDDLEEEIDRKLKNLQIGEEVTVIFYNAILEKYSKVTEKVTEINVKLKRFKIGERVINFSDIFEIK